MSVILGSRLFLISNPVVFNLFRLIPKTYFIRIINYSLINVQLIYSNILESKKKLLPRELRIYSNWISS